MLTYLLSFLYYHLHYTNKKIILFVLIYVIIAIILFGGSMKIKNYNNDIRHYILSKYDEVNMLIETDIDNFYSKLEQLFLSMKDNPYIMGVLYSTSFLVEKINLDEEDNILDFLESKDSLEIFMEECEVEDFDILCSDCSHFFSLDKETKKNYFYMLKPYFKKIIKVFPSFIIDIIHYLNSYDKQEIVDIYYSKYESGKENESKIDAVKHTCEHLNALKNKNFNNYSYLILDMIEDYYLYLSYLKSKGVILEEQSLTNLDLIENEPDFFIMILERNNELLFDLVLKYLNYELLNIREQEQIRKYYSDNEKIINKVYKKSYELKKNLMKNN